MSDEQRNIIPSGVAFVAGAILSACLVWLVASIVNPPPEPIKTERFLGTIEMDLFEVTETKGNEVVKSFVSRPHVKPLDKFYWKEIDILKLECP